MNTRLLYLFYFLSGLTALVYEVVWARKLGLIFGVDAWGIATVLSVFFIGLAVGSYVFGRIVNGHANWMRIGIVRMDANKPLVMYGLLEVGIGVYAAMTPFIFKLVANIVPEFYQALGGQFGTFNLAIFGLSVAVLFIPTIFMGGTFPVVAKAMYANKHANENMRIDANRVGMLYGLNTLGAVIGTVLAGFLMIWFLGMNMTTWLVAIVNMAIGAGAIYLSSKFNPSTSLSARVQSAKVQLKVQNGSNHKLLLFIFFLSGFAALALEVLWARVLILTFGTSTYAFAAVLAVFLFGIAAGSILASWLVKKRLNMSLLFSASLVVLGILVVSLTPILGNLPNLIINFFDPRNSSYIQIIAASFLLSFLVLILPTILMGVNFVLGVSIYSQSLERLAKDVGNLYGVNTLGGVIGAFVAGFILLPSIGIQKSIVIAAAGYIIAGALALGFLTHGRKYMKLTVVGIGIVSLLVGMFLPSWNKHLLSSGIAVYYRDYLEDREKLKESIERGEIMFYKEGLVATVLVKRAPEGYIFLRNNGKTDASTDQDLDDLRLIGHLPMMLHPNPKNVLSIGLGSGITLGSIAAHSLQEIEAVEIEPAVVEAAAYFKDYNNDVLSDPRIKIIQADVRGYLTAIDKKYDVISSQPSNLWVRGNAWLFTKEFFEIAKNSLEDDGLMLQWIPFYGMENRDFVTLLATFHSAFPYVTVWTPVVSHDVLLVGSKTSQRFDFEKVKSKLLSENVQLDLEDAAITTGESFLAHYLFDERALEKLNRNVQIHTDDKPILEFTTPFAINESTIEENLSTIIAINGDYSDHFYNLGQINKEEIEEIKRAIGLIFEAKIQSSQDDLEQAARGFEEALRKFQPLLTKKELARVYFELAKQAYDVNDLNKTVSYFEKSVKQNPNATASLNLAILYLQQNRLAKASKILDAAKRLEPNNPRLKEVERVINQARFKN